MNCMRNSLHNSAVGGPATVEGLAPIGHQSGVTVFPDNVSAEGSPRTVSASNHILEHFPYAT